MKIFSPAFDNGQPIPARHTCDGDDVSPELIISGVPERAESLVLIVDDPDARMGVWDHWIVFNLPPTQTILDEDVNIESIKPAMCGLNSWKNAGWSGPCPPAGTHRYYFTLHALKKKIPLKAGATKPELMRAIEHHILATARTMGTYARG